MIVVAVLIALIGVGTGVVVAAGGSSKGGSPAGSAGAGPVQVSGAGTPGKSQPSAAEEAHSRGSIMGLLDNYQTAYSNHDLSGLARIFSTGISRHGLAAGGCTVSRGRDAVLADYQSQFDENSGSYDLLDLRSSEIQLDSATRGHLHAHYQITPGGTGFVNFSFAELGTGWKISQVYATCA